MSRLDIFQSYDYFHRSGAQRNLTQEEETFLEYCCEYHDEICNEDTADNDPVIQEASRLYGNIP